MTKGHAEVLWPGGGELGNEPGVCPRTSSSRVLGGHQRPVRALGDSDGLAQGRDRGTSRGVPRRIANALRLRRVGMTAVWAASLGAGGDPAASARQHGSRRSPGLEGLPSGEEGGGLLESPEKCSTLGLQRREEERCLQRPHQ